MNVLRSHPLPAGRPAWPTYPEPDRDNEDEHQGPTDNTFARVGALVQLGDKARNQRRSA